MQTSPERGPLESDLPHTSGPRKLNHPKFKEEEENLRKTFTKQVKKEEARFRQWEQKLISQRGRLKTCQEVSWRGLMILISE